MNNSVQNFALFPDIGVLAQACAKWPDVAERFGTEATCQEWFIEQRWPHGFRCERCAGTGRWHEEKRGFECVRCRKFTSLTSGTLLHGTRKPLRTWVEAIYLIVQRGVNARTLQRELRLTYKTAWAWGHKLRELLAPFVPPEDRFEAERVRGARPTRMPDPQEPGPCGCTKLTKRDWGWPDDMEEERKAARLWRRFELGVPEFELWPRVMPARDEPRAGDIRAHAELQATYYGSLSEKHLRSYMDEVAFRWKRRLTAAVEGFKLVIGTLPTAPPRTWRQIVAKPRPEGHALSIYKVG